MASLYHGGFKTYVEQTFKKICTDRRGKRRTPASHNGAGEKWQRRVKNLAREQ
jgi:hypothetical protein